MSKLVWDADGSRYFETGVKKCVLYLKGTSGAQYAGGVAWNGITGITESPSGADVSDFYADDTKYATMRATETFGGTVEAYTYPDEWMLCDGSATIDGVPGITFGQQKRNYFGLCYRTTVGNDVDSELGYKLHLIYNATASPSERAYATINDSPDAITFSWELNTTPVIVAGHESTYKPVSNVTIDSTKLNADGLKSLAILENILYGVDESSIAAHAAKAYVVGDYCKVTSGSVDTYYVCTKAHTATSTTITEANWMTLGSTADPRLPLPEEIYDLFSKKYTA